MVVQRENWRGAGPVVVAVMGLTILACIPMALMRMGMALELADANSIGYASFGGTIIAIALGGFRIYSGRRSQLQYEILGEMPAGGTLSGETGGTGTLTAMGSATPEQDVMGTAWLHFTAGPRTGQSIPLPAGTVSVGRGIENDIVLDDATVSRSHATIAFRDGEYYIEDVGSMSGTMVEGLPAISTALASGVTLKMGEAEMVFMQTGAIGPSNASGLGSGMTGGTGPGSSRSGSDNARPAETMVMQPAQGAVMAWLAVTSGASKGKSYQLREGDNTI